MSAAEELGVRPWVSWQAFEKALKAQFEPLSKEEWAREQIQKLVQTRNVNMYIYRFHELKNEIPSMNSAEVYSLFMHGFNPQLHQLARTMVASGDLEEVIKIVKKAMVYGKDKGRSSQGKTENKQKRQSGGKGGGKGNKGNWGPSGGPKGNVQIIARDSQQEVTAGIVMAVMGGASTSGGKTSKSNKQGKESKGK